MVKDIEGRTAFITGGANGIGLGIARAFARAGAKIALADVDLAGLGRAAAELSDITQVSTIVLDVRDRAAYVRAADDAEARLGPVSLLFNNAGVGGETPVEKLSFELWDWSLGINLQGVINGVQIFMPRMVARGRGGHIVNTASAAGLAASGAGVLYHTAKYAVVGMAESLALELEPFGIGVSALCPGPVATDIVRRSHMQQPAADLRADQIEAADAKRVRMSKWLAKGASPEAVGDLVLGAVRENRLYIHTDRWIAPFVEARAATLLASMPVSPPEGR
jgi:NAD(P)-dependent dehydrogenase (short-subunit alcohol dehydrogenase family)